MDQQIAHCYVTLELEYGASEGEIRKAYRELVKVWHPDRFPSDSSVHQRAQEKLKAINLAYEILTSQARREKGNSCQSSPDKNVITVGRFFFYDTFCDEMTGANLFSDSAWAAKQFTEELFATIAEWARSHRGVQYDFREVITPEFGRARLTHSDLRRRVITLNRAGKPNFKSALMPLAILFIRDKVNGIPNDHKEPILRALKYAGWKGEELFLSEGYIRAELVLSNLTSEDFLNRTLNKPTGLANWWTDVKSGHRLMDSLDDCGRWLGNSLAYQKRQPR